MRIFNTSVLSSTDMGSSFSLTPIFLGHIAQYSAQLIWTGTPTGTWKLQASNDLGSEDKTSGGWSSAGVTNWTDIADSNQAVAGAAGDHTWDVADVGYRWVRVVWTRSSGTGTLTSARINGKGI